MGAPATSTLGLLPSRRGETPPVRPSGASRHFESDARSAAGMGCDDEPAAGQRRALTHVQEPVSGRPAFLAERVHLESDAVVFDLEADSACIVGEPDAHTRGARVDGAISQRLLNDAEDRRFDVLRASAGKARAIELEVDPGAALEPSQRTADR